MIDYTKYCVGIDPPKGYAVWNSTKRIFEEIITTNFWGIIDKLESLQHINFRVSVFVEAPQNNAPVWLKNKRNVSEQERRKLSRITQNVGENKRAAILITQKSQRLGFKTYECTPGKGTWTKMKPEMFQRITGYSKRTSEHGRDAAMLVFQRSG